MKPEIYSNEFSAGRRGTERSKASERTVESEGLQEEEVLM